MTSLGTINIKTMCIGFFKEKIFLLHEQLPHSSLPFFILFFLIGFQTFQDSLTLSSPLNHSLNDQQEASEALAPGRALPLCLLSQTRCVCVCVCMCVCVCVCDTGGK